MLIYSFLDMHSKILQFGWVSNIIKNVAQWKFSSTDYLAVSSSVFLDFLALYKLFTPSNKFIKYYGLNHELNMI